MTPSSQRRSRRSQRRKAREKAMQLLFQMEATGDPLPVAAESYWAEHPASADAKAYAVRLAEAVDAHREEIDTLIAGAAEHWPLNRMSAVDRNLLRMAVGELLYIDDVPPKVTIDEAVDIAKEYGSEDGGKFVNGVLDRVWSDARAAENA